MLYNLEKYYKNIYDENIWTNDKLTYYDPAAGMGNFPIAIYYKLMNGLKNKIPNIINRKKHILENMIFMSELNKKNCYIIKQIFNIDNILKLNLYEGDSLKIDIKKEFNKKKFDIIIGNPPYNEELKKTGGLPLYNKFVDYYINKCNMLTFIIPSRWFSCGKGLDTFRENMLNRKDIVYIKHYNNACKIFGNSVNINGGVNYFLKDRMYDGECDYNGNLIQLNKYDILVDNKYYNIINKIVDYPSITDIYLGRYYGIETNDKNLCNDDTLLKCYVSQQKGFIKYIDKKHIKKDYKFWKIITTRANGTHNSGFGNTFIGNKKDVHTGSYLSFKIDSKEEAESLLSYFRCNLPNFMLSLRKNSQDIKESTCKWIPQPPLNKIWNNKNIYKYFKLSNEEIDIIENANINGFNKK
jgi:site-specific DNA-methyltransferase (adenine-specific)